MLPKVFATTKTSHNRQDNLSLLLISTHSPKPWFDSRTKIHPGALRERLAPLCRSQLLRSRNPNKPAVHACLSVETAPVQCHTHTCMICLMARSFALELVCLRRVSISTSQPRLHLEVLILDVIPPLRLPFTISILGPTFCRFMFFLPPLLACIVARLCKQFCFRGCKAVCVGVESSLYIDRFLSQCSCVQASRET